MQRIVNKENRLPREVMVASVGLKGLWPEQTIEKRIKDMFARMESVFAFEPDIICLPETFQFSWVDEIKLLDVIAEDETTMGPVTSRVAEIAKKQGCYITCPIITKKDSHFYNSSILINRQGKIDGIYHKAHPVDIEIIPEKCYKGGGMTPGVLNPPVFRTDFGTIGMQICFDASYFDTWRSLKEDGAEIVFFPSQGPFGDILSYHAWMNRYNIVSSTGEDARIIDITGDVIAADSEFERWVCAPLNLEKVVLHLSPHIKKFDAIQEKYRRKIRFKLFPAENWATLESQDPYIIVMDILKEYEIPTYDEQTKEATEIQDKYRL
jgi:predicted amidohydrolase